MDENRERSEILRKKREKMSQKRAYAAMVKEKSALRLKDLDHKRRSGEMPRKKVNTSKMHFDVSQRVTRSTNGRKHIENGPPNLKVSQSMATRHHKNTDRSKDFDHSPTEIVTGDNSGEATITLSVSPTMECELSHDSRDVTLDQLSNEDIMSDQSNLSVSPSDPCHERFDHSLVRQQQNDREGLIRGPLCVQCKQTWVRLSKKVQKAQELSRKSKNREAKLRRKNFKLIEANNILLNKMNSWKVRYYKTRKMRLETDPILKRVRDIEAKGKTEIRKNLIISETLQQQLRENKDLLVSADQKNIFAQILSGDKIRKRRLVSKLSSINSRYLQSKNTIFFKKRSGKRDDLTRNMRSCVLGFLERNDNSILCPGKGDKISRNGKTMQKRYLTDTLFNLHKKYQRENNPTISKSAFYKFKPFWIVSKRLTDRDTCLCKMHDNALHLIRKLSFLKVLPSRDPHDLISSLTCDPKNESCMARTCPDCKNRLIKHPEDDTLSFCYQWADEKLSRLGAKNKVYDVKVAVKKKIICTISEIVNRLNMMIPSYLKHVHLMQHQYAFLQEQRANLKSNEVQLVCDFSQNLLGKYAEEISKTHFGASKKQISLHTGVFYYLNAEGELCCVSFCTVSECLRHDAAAIWAHLEPILELIGTTVPNFDTINFQSDGPTTQYKNKTNFQIFRDTCSELKLKKASWNFTAPGHGKSCADGTGGTVKRMCDRAVLSGQDVMSSKDVIRVVEASPDAKIKVFEITEDDISRFDHKINPDINPAPNSQKIFQLLWSHEEPKLLHLNYLSCLECLSQPPCSHFRLFPGTWNMDEKKSRRTNIPKKTETEIPSVEVSERMKQVQGTKKKASQRSTKSKDTMPRKIPQRAPRKTAPCGRKH